jgi:plasmanylethanolamine desaturase
VPLIAEYSGRFRLVEAAAVCLLIRSFREHHVDREAMTRHDFVETNGATALVLLPVVAAVHLSMPADPSAWTVLHVHGSLLALNATFFVFLTNQIHKWAHVERPPRVVRLLQRVRLMLPADHHRMHHAGDHTSRYCITTGWLNPVFDRTGLFKRAEQAIQRLSGVQPREDDAALRALAADTRVSGTVSGRPSAADKVNSGSDLGYS